MSKKLYESYVIIDGNLEDAAIEEEIKKYESLLLKNDVEINKIDRIGRKRLAYAIKKRMNGYYVCFEIFSPPNILSKIQRTFKLDENILRYLTIFISTKTRKEKDEHFKHKALLQSKYEEAKEKKATTESADNVENVKEPVEVITKEVLTEN